MNEIPVIFRKDKNEVTAFFPTFESAIGTVCYSHIGQHSEASIDYYRSTVPAKPEEYQTLFEELKGIYNDEENTLVIKQKR